jgi:hypothetical protein
MERFSIDITLDAGGVRVVRVFGENWEQGTAAYALLGRVGCALQQLHDLARLNSNTDSSTPSSPGASR